MRDFSEFVVFGQRNAHRSSGGNWNWLAITCLLLAWASRSFAAVFMYSYAPAGTPHVYSVNQDGTNRQQLTTGSDTMATFSPDGTKFAFVRNGNTIFCANRDGSNVVQVSPPGHITNSGGVATGDIRPDWSPDGTKIVYTHMSVNSSTGAALHGEIYTMSAVDGSGEVQIRGDGTNIFTDAHISPNGNQLVYGYGAGGGAEHVYKCTNLSSCNSTEVALLVSGVLTAGSPVWWPDGSKILFILADPTVTSGNVEIGTVNSSGPDGAGLNVITSYVEPVHDPNEPAASPDGTQIAFSMGDCTGLGSGCNGGGDPAAPTTLWVMNADGTGAASIGQPSISAAAPKWDP